MMSFWNSGSDVRGIHIIRLVDRVDGGEYFRGRAAGAVGIAVVGVGGREIETTEAIRTSRRWSSSKAKAIKS